MALENGLFALPFEFQPYDYSEFQGEVDKVVESFGTSVAEIKAASLGTYDNVAKMKADTTLKANTTVLTTGEATVGDNKGSFYRVQDTSDRPDAVPLNNGKKAVPFALDVGAVAGTALTFVGKSDAAAVWNVKAPGTVTIPLSVSAGGVATVFLGVLYDANESTVTATLNINNGNVKTMTFTDKGDTTHDKIVVYAITVKYDGSAYSWGSATSASWLVDYQRDKVTVTVQLPEGAPTDLTTIGTSVSSQVAIKPKVNMYIREITAQCSVITLSVGISKLGGSKPLFSAVGKEGETKPQTFHPNITLEAGTTYSIGASGIDLTSIFNPKYYGASTSIPLISNDDFEVVDASSHTERKTSFVLVYDK